MRMKFAGECRTVRGLARERDAKAAGVSGEGMVEQKKSPAEVNGTIHQVDLRTPLSQIVSSGHSSQSRADDEDLRFGI